MSGSIIGGNTEELSRLASAFRSQAQEVDSLMSTLTNEVNETWWQGGASDRFRQAWESEYQPALRNLANALDDAASEIDSRNSGLQQVGS